MKAIYRNTLQTLKEQEESITLVPERVVAETRKMVTSLQEHLEKLKEYVLKHGFENTNEEIEFFKTIKPVIFGKLLYYNKIFRIESERPIEVGSISQKFFNERLGYFTFQNDLRKSEYANHPLHCNEAISCHFYSICFGYHK